MSRFIAHVLLTLLLVCFLIRRLLKSVFYSLEDGKRKIRNVYPSREYWENRGKTFIQEDYQRGLYWQHDWMLEKLCELKPVRVLEIGCGFGRNLRFMTSKLDGFGLVGVDFSLSMLSQAKNFLSDSPVPLAAADALALPFPDDLFDVVIVHGVFMHIPPNVIDKAVRELWRVAKTYVIQCEQNYSGFTPNALGVVQINECTYAYNYLSLFERQKIFVLEYQSVKDLDAFLLLKRSAKYDVPEPIELEKLYPEYSHALILPLVPEQSTVLDIGCATGYLGRYLVERQYCIVDGVEQDIKAAAIAKQFYRHVWNMSLDNIKCIEENPYTYDVILCAAVLEHTLQPEEILKRLRKIIKPNGFVIISLPNVAHWTIRWQLLRGHFDYEDYGILDRTHLRFFTYQGASELLDLTGYQIEKFLFSTPGITDLERPLLSIPKVGHSLRIWLLAKMPYLFGFELIFVARPKEA